MYATQEEMLEQITTWSVCEFTRLMEEDKPVSYELA